MKKKDKTINGILMCPLAVGASAHIFHQGMITHTSRIVAIHSRTTQEVCFETLNTNYRLILNPFPFAASSQYAMNMAA